MLLRRAQPARAHTEAQGVQAPQDAHLPVLRQELHPGDLSGQAHAETRGENGQETADNRHRAQAVDSLDGRASSGPLLAEGQPGLGDQRLARSVAASSHRLPSESESGDAAARSRAPRRVHRERLEATDTSARRQSSSEQQLGVHADLLDLDKLHLLHATPVEPSEPSALPGQPSPSVQAVPLRGVQLDAEIVAGVVLVRRHARHHQQPERDLVPEPVDQPASDQELRAPAEPRQSRKPGEPRQSEQSEQPKRDDGESRSPRRTQGETVTPAAGRGD